MIRWWQLAMLAGLVTQVGAQDVPAAAAAGPHGRICSGDEAAPPRPTLLDGYGGGGFAVATTVPAAQRFFDNGMQLGAAFAHSAARAAMAEAVRLDPGCAMCRWGDAWTNGPNLNDAAADPKLRAANAAKVARAAALATVPRERALIAALALRFDPAARPAAANLAYARAMDVLATRDPADDQLATLAADGWLIASFDQRPRAGRSAQYRAVALLERVLARRPDYTPAIHFYIHATEIAGFPARATPYADRLERLAPRASHLVHMPSHTYYWIGRYQDAADSNRRAVLLGIANARRLGMALPDGVWDLPYHAHNVHFGVGGAMMAGDAKTALLLSDPLVAVAAKRTAGSTFFQAVALMGYAAEGRYADPARVLALPEPKLPYVRAFRHYARGEALARQGDAAAVAREGAAIEALLADRAGYADATGNDIARLAALVLRGRAAMLRGDAAAAIPAFAAATALEEGKVLRDYSDPPLWWYPVRRSLAEARLAAGDPAGALADADRSLRRRPLDPLTLAVRARAAAALGGGRAAVAARDARAALVGWRGGRALFARALI